MTETETIAKSESEHREQLGYLIFDSESIPDGRLLREVKYRGEPLTEPEAIERAQKEAREQSWTGSDFLPASFQIPISICIARVGVDFSLLSIKCLGAPKFDPREIVQEFWKGIKHYTSSEHRVKFVSFNGRGFDFPLMELAAFRYGLSAPRYYESTRRRFDSQAVDLLDWFNNFGAIRHVGGVNLLAKLLGKPGKIDVAGDRVYSLWREGRLPEINDYCMCDTLDTYFVFLRSCVMRGDITLQKETALVHDARDFIGQLVKDHPGLQDYLAHWSADAPWP